MKNTTQICLSLLLVAQLTACAVAAVGAGGAAGYYVAKEDRTPQQILSDAGITAGVNAKYVKDRDVSAININVDTRNGVVTLYGSVASHAIEERAISLASEVKGVKKIISKITVVK